MSSFQLDRDGDLLLTNNALTLTTGLEAIRQHLQCKFRLFMGEWFLDLEAGVPWFQEVFKKNTSFVVLQEIFKDTILTTPGVIELNAISRVHNGLIMIKTGHGNFFIQEIFNQ